MILIIAEKPSVRAKIKEALQINTTIRQRSYEESSKFILTNAIGHLAKLKMPEDISDDLKVWDLDKLPFRFKHIPLVANENTKEQWATVKRLLNDKRVTEIVNACDPEREGELIFRNLLELANANKNIKSSRMWITSMTNEGVKEAFNKRLPLSDYDNLSHAAKARSYADYLIGLNTTRGVSKKLNGRYSTGRVQTPVLKIIVDREEQIKNFKSSKYFKLVGILKGRTELEIDYKNDDLENNAFLKKEDAQNTINKIGTGDIKVIQAIIDNKAEYAPHFFNLSGLQIEMNKKFGLSPDETLNIAQTLYEKYALITYPRTDETRISKKFANETGQIIKNLPVFKDLTEKIINNGWKLKNKHIVDDSKIGAHEALTPVIGNISVNNIKALNENERNVFEAIYRRFIAGFFPPAKIQTQNVLFERNEELFTRNVSDVVELGYKEVFKESLKDSKIIPGIKEGQTFNLSEIKLTEHDTTAPRRLTEGELIRIMEKPFNFVEGKDDKDTLKKVKGIGTEATRASIIQGLKRIGYIELKGKGKTSYIHPTEKGIDLINKVPSEKLKSVSLTANIEQGLSMVEEGRVSYDKFMSGIDRIVNDMISEIKEMKTVEGNSKSFKKNEKSFKVKTFWDGNEIDMVENDFVYSSVDKDLGIVIFKNNFEKFFGYKKITLTQAKELLEKGKTSKKVKLHSKKKGKDFEAFFVYDKDTKRINLAFE